MPITLPGDPPPNSSYRWIVPSVLALLLTLTVAPFLVVWHHNSVVEENQNKAIDALRHYAELQAKFFAREKRYGSFDELGDSAWAEFHDMRSLAPTNYHGYRFHSFSSQSKDAAGGALNYVDSAGHWTGGYAMMAVPVDYGYTGRMTFFISAPGDAIFYIDFNVATDAVTRALDQYSVPAGAKEMKGMQTESLKVQ